MFRGSVHERRIRREPLAEDPPPQARGAVAPHPRLLQCPRDSSRRNGCTHVSMEAIAAARTVTGSVRASASLEGGPRGSSRRIAIALAGVLLLAAWLRF